MGASTTGGTQAAGSGGTQSSGGASGASSGGSAQGGDAGSSAGAGGSSGTAGSGDGGASDGGAGPCDGFVGLATPAETALTPRDDSTAEILALRASEGIVAPETVYQRVVRDLGAIRQDYPDVADITPFPRANASSISVSFDADTLDDVALGTYTGWDCPNELYGFADSGPPSTSGVVRVRFEGRYDPSLLASEYEDLPGVTDAWESVTVGDGNDIMLDPEGETYHWIFVTGSGDCPAGCINHEYWGFTTTASGAITYHGSTVDSSLDQAWLDLHTDRTTLP
jgi:hypothetical protein